MLLQEDMSYKTTYLGDMCLAGVHETFLMKGCLDDRLVAFVIKKYVSWEDMSYCRTCLMGEYVYWDYFKCNHL